MCHDCQMFTISEGYWFQIMREMIDNGFVRGFIMLSTKRGVIIQMTNEAGITLKGRDGIRDMLCGA